MSDSKPIVTDLDILSSVIVDCESVALEEEVITDTSLFEAGDGDPDNRVKIEVTLVNSDGSSEVVVANVEDCRSKRPASGASLEDGAPRKMTKYSSAKNDGAGNEEPDYVLSIESTQGSGCNTAETQNNPHIFKCFLCGESKFPKWSQLLLHFDAAHCATENRVTKCKCPTCGLILTLTQEGGIDDFDSLVLNALSHMVREHDYSDDNVTTMTRKIDNHCSEKVRCEKCDAMVRADYLKKHLTYYCKGCRKVFDCKCGKKILPSSMPSHSNVCAFLRTEKACTCPDCGLLFKTVHNMELHFRRCHLKECRYACEICDEKFFKRDVLVQHNYISHNINMDSRPILTCNFENCSFTAIYAYHLNQHIKRQHEKGPFICERCDKICNTYYTLNRHQCVFRELRGRRVTAHVNPVEEKKKSQAGPSSSSATSGVRLYKCSECNFTNASRKRVELHGRIHRDELLHATGAVLNIDNLSNSQEPQEPQEHEEIVYCCGECGFTSGDQEVLQQHLETVHSGENRVVNHNEVELESTGNAFEFDAASLPVGTSSLQHSDAEAVSLLNHFKMGNAEVILDSAAEIAETPGLVMEVVAAETVSLEDDSSVVETSIVPDAVIPVLDIQGAENVTVVQQDPSMLPKKSTTLAKNAPRLFHELTKANTLNLPEKKQSVVWPADALQEYKIVFEDNADHPTPPGQVILLSPEEAEQLMIHQQADVQIT